MEFLSTLDSCGRANKRERDVNSYCYLYDTQHLLSSATDMCAQNKTKKVGVLTGPRMCISIVEKQEGTINFITPSYSEWTNFEVGGRFL